MPETFAVGALRKRFPQRPYFAQGGYFCFDRFTPITKHTFEQAVASTNIALSGASHVLRHKKAAFSLCRPPGHHAGHELYGGFCYFNNAAIAATYLSLGGDVTTAKDAEKRVAILDIDFHHGNGTQDICYENKNLMYASIHACPDSGGEPYFIGYEEEVGEGEGTGTNFNFPLKGTITTEVYLATLAKAISKIKEFDPEYLVISAGWDIMETDPIGWWKVTTDGIGEIGRTLAGLDLPTLVVLEGGYDVHKLGGYVKAFISPF